LGLIKGCRNDIFINLLYETDNLEATNHVCKN
jgi:hypothetical protein